MVQAAEQVGSDGKGKGGVEGYMHRLADEKTGHFIPLLRQAVQKQAPAAKQPDTAVVYRSEDEFRQALVERGVHSTLLPAPARDPLERPPTDLKPPQPPPGWQWTLRRSDETAEPDTNETVTVETDQDAETAADEPMTEAEIDRRYGSPRHPAPGYKWEYNSEYGYFYPVRIKSKRVV
jgi:hypothetical protein